MSDKKPIWPKIPTYEDYFPEGATRGKNNAFLEQQLTQANNELKDLREYRDKAYDRIVGLTSELNQAGKDKQELAILLKDIADYLDINKETSIGSTSILHREAMDSNTKEKANE